jgi:hypothetical protein
MLDSRGHGGNRRRGVAPESEDHVGGQRCLHAATNHGMICEWFNFLGSRESDSESAVSGGDEVDDHLQASYNNVLL